MISISVANPYEQDLDFAALKEAARTVLAGEGVKKLAVVTDDPEKYRGIPLPAGVAVHHRDEIEAVQRDFREYPNVSVIVYDQPCATERRRLRKRAGGVWQRCTVERRREWA